MPNRLCAFGAFVLMLMLNAAPAAGSAQQEAIFQDNDLLLAAPARLDPTLRTLRRIGVDRLRVTVQWSAIAPAPDSRLRPPGFDPAKPGDYAPGGWAPFDRLARAAKRYGLALDFNLTGGAPLWAVGRAPARSMLHVWDPSSAQFGAFVEAVGRRYDGRYAPPGASKPLPRVRFWSIWNEPNVGSSSLSPQTVRGIEVSPRRYRALLDRAYAALGRTGHRRDTILIGETASTGHLDPGAALGMPPLRFLRALYCVDGGYQPLRGSAAKLRGCPTTAAASRRFPVRNPALFAASGWGHHPYNLGAAPGVPAPAFAPDWVTMANLPKLEQALDRAQQAYGSSRQLPVYLTEYGIETNPPRRDFTTTPAQQAQYLNQAEYMAWRDPRVRAVTQYLLEDPSGRAPFASGLIFAGGVKKPSFRAYRLALWVPQLRLAPGGSLEVWGCVRPAKRFPGIAAPVEIQLGGRTIRSIPVANRRGYFDVRVAFPHAGAVRLAWRYPGGRTVYSRTATITETGGASGTWLPAAVAGAVLLALAAFAALRQRSRRRAAAS